MGRTCKESEQSLLVVGVETRPSRLTREIRCVQGSSALISPFSTVPFEAMARGVPFVYHNPYASGFRPSTIRTELSR